MNARALSLVPQPCRFGHVRVQLVRPGRFRRRRWRITCERCGAVWFLPRGASVDEATASALGASFYGHGPDGAIYDG